MTGFIRAFEESHGWHVKKYSALSGGDISSVYHLQMESTDAVLKINSAEKADMFETEASGLKLLGEARVIRVPEVFGTGIMEGRAYLLIEYIQPGKANNRTFLDFGQKLADLHFVTNEKFGLEENNFIGSLPQTNFLHQNWAEFYWHERLHPQFQLAIKRNLISTEYIPEENSAIKTISNIFEAHAPALLHGDLWSGNYLIAENGEAVLIDPSVHFGHPYMDIGMTKLFGGFPPEFYDAYFQFSALKKNDQPQTDLAQLYYLLVHLNLFGVSYLSSVERILSRYFQHD